MFDAFPPAGVVPVRVRRAQAPLERVTVRTGNEPPPSAYEMPRENYPSRWALTDLSPKYTVKNFRIFTDTFFEIIRIFYGTSSVDMAIRESTETRLFSVRQRKSAQFPYDSGKSFPDSMMTKYETHIFAEICVLILINVGFSQRNVILILQTFTLEVQNEEFLELLAVYLVSIFQLLWSFL